ncbi:hypothetical protein LCGC14_0277780 [marine sediment metagenome]|uniref:Phosphoadenosine phosphosulphate reductase domain-containing protein n=1 Tax=marine sediment metagenome TaxID=412755 RepID=A0A0F9U1N7_9ZZZZ
MNCSGHTGIEFPLISLHRMKISSKELNDKINWTLNQKIDHSLYIIDSFHAMYPDSKISFSGGVDSTVMLHLVKIIDKDKIPVFSNTTNEFSEILRFVKTIENIEIVHPNTTFIKTVNKYGFPLISKKVAKMIATLRDPGPHNEASRKLYLTGIKRDGTKSKYFKLPKKYRYLIDVPFDVTNKCCDILKINPLRPFRKNGMLVGTMATDSFTRRYAYLQTGCINIIKHTCSPLSIWTKENIWEFIKQNNVRYCDIYDKGESYTGCAYCGFGIMFDKTRFERLKEREPKRYNQMMNIKNNGITYEEALKILLHGTK